MKITHIASGDLWAGAEKQLFVLLTTLNHVANVDVNAIVLNPGELADRLQQAQIPVLILNEATSSSRVLHRQIFDHLQAHRPDIVHTHRTKENILGGLAASRLGIPSLRTQHGAEEHPWSFRNLRRSVLGLADYLIGRVLQKRVIAVSEPLRKALAQSYGKHKVAMISNGIEPRAGLNIDCPPRHWPTGDHWRIGIVGRLVPVKRVDIFLDIAEAVTEQIPNARTLFQVIGDGPLRAALEQQAATKPTCRIEFSGHVANPDLFLDNLDILVICSDHEGLPMVALEAMRSGAVVVTHPIGGLPTLLEQGKSGVLVAQQTSEAFAQAILELMKNPQHAARLSLAARRRIQDNYSSDQMTDQYLSQYSQLLR